MTTNTRRKRRTRAEILAETLAKAEKIKAQLAGEWSGDNDTSIVGKIKGALRKRKTAVHAANVTINGRAATENSPSINGVDEQIARLETRLSDKKESKIRALAVLETCPDDITRLEALLQEALNGQDVEFPDDLTPLPTGETTSELEFRVRTDNETN
jgi:hypothetical protein